MARRYIARIIVLSVWIVCGLVVPSMGSSLPWIEGDVEGAIEAARSQDKRVMVYVTASWCSSCQALKREVLEVPAHGELLGEFVLVRVDFDLEASRRWVEALVILGLPTVVVLDSGGRPVGRIRGYGDAESWTRELAALGEKADGRQAIEAAGREPGARPDAQLMLGRLLLERGETQDGLAMLRAVATGGHEVAAPAALFILGRFHHRVRRSPESARPLWRELAIRYPKSPLAGGAWWWYARAEAEAGSPGIGARALLDAARSSPGEAPPIRRAAAYLEKHGSLAPVMKSEVLAGVERTLSALGDEGQREPLEALRARLLAPPP
jgi:thioredoxin-related protein